MSTLSAARADNFYFPKDFDPNKHKSIGDYNRKKKAEKAERKAHFLNPSGKPKDHKQHEPANKVRYETPFHVRCEQCHNQIAKGVRFNAAKRAIGRFHSTTIWEFSFNCVRCGNRIKVETDPEKCDYRYVLGAKRIFQTENASEGQIVDMALEKAKKENIFVRLEHQAEDREVGRNQKPRIHLLQQMQERLKDDFSLNSMLRKRHRETTAQMKSENVKKKLKLEEISEWDQRIVDSVQFDTEKHHAKKMMMEKRRSISDQSIFAGSKDKIIQSQISVKHSSTGLNKWNQDMLKLNQKVSRLPEATIKALRIDQKSIAGQRGDFKTGVFLQNSKI